jgi:hypothetical protein
MMQPLPQLRLAVSVAEVGNWQRFLNTIGVRDYQGQPLKDDEQYGVKTASAARRFQVDRKLQPSGVVDELTRKFAIVEGFIPFVQAKHADIHFPNKNGIRRLIVIHTMENPEKPYQAENVALWFAGRTQAAAPAASAHFCIDEDSLVQCVRETDDAWHAGPVNGYSIGIEHAGYANQNAGQWEDTYSLAVLWRSAKLASALCKRYNIPVEHVTQESLKNGTAHGFCGHVDVTMALNGGKGHTDPGPNFPWAHYLELVLLASTKLTSA